MEDTTLIEYWTEMLERTAIKLDELADKHFNDALTESDKIDLTVALTQNARYVERLRTAVEQDKALNTKKKHFWNR